MRIPTIHLNGTGKQTLLDELEKAYMGVGTALELVKDVTVNGRDYYVQGPNAYTEARSEMDARIGRLESVKKELGTMYTALQEQGRKPSYRPPSPWTLDGNDRRLTIAALRDIVSRTLSVMDEQLDENGEPFREGNAELYGELTGISCLCDEAEETTVGLLLPRG